MHSTITPSTEPKISHRNFFLGCVSHCRWMNAASGHFPLFCIQVEAIVCLFENVNNISSDLVNYILSDHSLEYDWDSLLSANSQMTFSRTKKTGNANIPQKMQLYTYKLNTSKHFIRLGFTAYIWKWHTTNDNRQQHKCNSFENFAPNSKSFRCNALFPQRILYLKLIWLLIKVWI